MPRVENPRAVESRFIHWMKKGVNQSLANNRQIKPKFAAFDSFSLAYGRLPYRHNLDLVQIYSRFGPLEAVYQLAHNAALATFHNVQSTRHVLSRQGLGLPYGRLYARRWTPTKLDPDYYRAMKHVLKAADTQTRFHSLMDKDDRLTKFTTFRTLERNFCDSSRSCGQHLLHVLCNDIHAVVSEEAKKPTASFIGESSTVNVFSRLDYNAAIGTLGKVVVVDFYATWCGPCKRMGVFINDLLNKRDNLLLVRVDVNDCADIVEEADVTALPTFHFYQNAVLMEKMVGASEERFLEILKNLT